MSKTKPAIIILATVMVLSALTLVLVPAVYHPTHIIKAVNLSQTPASYMLLEEPDPYVLEAISNPKGVEVHSLDVTMIDELMHQQLMENDTRNFQINGDYYQFLIFCVDCFPPVSLSKMHLASYFIFPISMIGFLMITIIVLKRNKKQKVSKV